MIALGNRGSVQDKILRKTLFPSRPSMGRGRSRCNLKRRRGRGRNNIVIYLEGIKDREVRKTIIFLQPGRIYLHWLLSIELAFTDFYYRPTFTFTTFDIPLYFSFRHYNDVLTS